MELFNCSHCVPLILLVAGYMYMYYHLKQTILSLFWLKLEQAHVFVVIVTCAKNRIFDQSIDR